MIEQVAGGTWGIAHYAVNAERFGKNDEIRQYLRTTDVFSCDNPRLATCYDRQKDAMFEGTGDRILHGALVVPDDGGSRLNHDFGWCERMTIKDNSHLIGLTLNRLTVKRINRVEKINQQQTKVRQGEKTKRYRCSITEIAQHGGPPISSLGITCHDRLVGYRDATIRAKTPSSSSGIGSHPINCGPVSCIVIPFRESGDSMQFQSFRNTSIKT